MRVYHSCDANPRLIKGKRIAVLGFGNQGRAQALNLRDSGADVVIGVRPGKSARQAKRDGFPILSVSQAVKEARFAAVMLPDTYIPEVFQTEVFPVLSGPACFVFAHGYSLIHGGMHFPKGCDVVLAAPLGPGNDLRVRYLERKGVACWLAIHRNGSGKALQNALAYAWGIGSLRAGAIRTTVDSEVTTDLFGERAVLVGGLLAIALSGFETLQHAGLSAEAAYLETAYQLRSLAELLERHGPEGMLQCVSQVAREGSLAQLPRLTGALQPVFEEILQEVQRGGGLSAPPNPYISESLAAGQSTLEKLRAVGLIS